MKKTKISFISILTLLFSGSVIAAEGYYKWTDAEGTVHYSERAPEDDASSAEFIKTKKSRKKTETPPAEQIPTSKEGEPEEESSEEPPVKEVFKKDMASCQQALKAKQTMMSNPIILGKDGKVMTVDQKNKELQKLEEIIKVHC